MSELPDVLPLSGVRTPEQEGSRELHLVKDAFNSKFPPIPGSFLHYLLMAFLNADRDNFDILLPVMKNIIKKYNLECNCKVKVV